MNLVTLPARSGGAPRSKAQDGDASAVVESRKFNVDRSKREAMMEKNKKRVEEQIAADHAKHKLKPPQAAAAERLSDGTPVKVVGLDSAPEVNGKDGVVLGFDASKDRYRVQLQGRSKMCSLKPVNCQASPGRAA